MKSQYYLGLPLLCFGIETRAALTLLRGGTFITYDSSSSSLKIINDGAMLFNDTILAISTTTDGLDTQGGSPAVVNTTGKIISPGFIDTHRHVWQTAMRTTGPNTQLAPYFWTYGSFGLPAFHFTPEDVYIGELMGSLEGLNAGVTSTLDYAHSTWTRAHAEAGLQGVIDSGSRTFWCYQVTAVPDNADPFSLNFSAPADQIEHIKLLASRRPFNHGLVSLGLAYDSFTTPGAAEVASLAPNLSLSLVTGHDVNGVYGTPGGTVITTVNNLGLLNSSIPYVFAHSSDLTPQEVQILRNTNQHISIVAESDMSYAIGHHTHTYLAGDHASLGVDTHFTFSTDIITQMRTWLQSTRLQLNEKVLENFQIPSKAPVSVQQAYLLGTRNGGLALGRPDLGVLEKGAKADIVIFSTDSVKLVGWSDPIAAIVLHSNVADIESVYVNGELVKKNGQLVTDWRGKGYGARLEASAAKWRGVLASANLTSFQAGVQAFTGWTNLAEPFQVDVTPGSSTGF